MGERYTISIADWGLARGSETVRTCGLGSCVGVVLYDEERKLAAMGHIMLPDSTSSRNRHPDPWKYADTAIPALMEKAVSAGAISNRLKAKLAGGAQMFPFTAKLELMRIGQRNVEAVKAALQALAIEITGSETGGENGRTIEFYPATSCLHVRTVHVGETIL
ncbi:chemotaxis protein CheD [Shouchella shacheensis]|uniref:chemotaxis protein CheD n=1 Tax=Shouchella shacheensis TaxID=1649580 RepID=UPI00074002EC|nr:chemotaxis protein CheD [Shouchella shacheensis]